VDGFKEGDRVVVDPILSCRRCAACHEGRFNACGSLRLRGIDLPGGMAEQVVCDAFQLFKYPESLPMEHSPMAELYSIACHTAVRAGLAPADTVAVFGAGKVGLSVLDVFRQMGTYRLIAVDVIDERLAIAERLGVDVTINAKKEDPVAKIMDMTEGTGVDKAVEAIGHYDEIDGVLPPVAAAAEVLRSAGRMVVLGQGPQETPLFLKPLVWREIEIIMSRVSLGEFGRAVRMMERGVLHPDELITDTCPLAETGAMFEELEKDKASHVKVVLEV
jgi:threonine dehydrogenase-like Zn-dependent dehydrogenase